jgi:hypothetical protein
LWVTVQTEPYWRMRRICLRSRRTAGGGVIEGVLLEGARRLKLEAESGEAGLEKLEVVDGNLSSISAFCMKKV